MNRRSFFGATTAAVVAGPSAVAEAVLPARPPAVLGFAYDYAPLRAAAGELIEISEMVGKVRPFAFPSDREPYVHRTGNAAVDALRSVSGVYREQMLKRMERG